MTKKWLINEIEALASEYLGFCATGYFRLLKYKTKEIIEDKLDAFCVMIEFAREGRRLLDDKTDEEKIYAALTSPPPDWYIEATNLLKKANEIWLSN